MILSFYILYSIMLIFCVLVVCAFFILGFHMSGIHVSFYCLLTFSPWVMTHNTQLSGKSFLLYVFCPSLDFLLCGYPSWSNPKFTIPVTLTANCEPVLGVLLPTLQSCLLSNISVLASDLWFCSVGALSSTCHYDTSLPVCLLHMCWN